MRDLPRAGVAVGDHHVEHCALAFHHVGVALLAVAELHQRALAVDVVAIDRAVAVEPLVALLVQLGAELGVKILRRAGLAEQPFVQQPRDGFVAVGVQVNAVVRELENRARVSLLRRIEEVHEGHAQLRCHRCHRVGVELEVRVVGLAVGEVRVTEILVGDGRDEHEPGRAAAGVVLLARVLDEVGEVGLELRHARRPGEGFVEAEEGEDDGGLAEREVLVGGTEVLRAQPRGEDFVALGVIGVLDDQLGLEVHLVGGEGEVADDEVVLGESLVEERLPVVVVLHPLGQRVADKTDVVAGFKSQASGRGGRGGRSEDLDGERDDGSEEGDGLHDERQLKDNRLLPSARAEASRQARLQRRLSPSRHLCGVVEFVP